MNRFYTAVPGLAAFADKINELINRARGVLPASQNNDYTATLTDATQLKGKGSQEIVWQPGGTIAADTPTLIDDTIDWRDRVCRVDLMVFTAANDRPGQASDYKAAANTGSGSLATAYYRAIAYLGTGGYGDAFGHAIDSSHTPVQSAGPPLSNCVLIAGGAHFFYADPTDGKLYYYTHGVGSVCVLAFVDGWKAGKR